MSTNCEQVRPLLTDYILQEVDAGATGVIREHLTHCQLCQAELNETQAMLGLLKRSEVCDELPRNIRVVSQPAAESPAGWWEAFWRSAGRLAFAGGALSCLAVGLLGAFSARVSYGAQGLQIAFGSQSEAATVESVSDSAASAKVPVIALATAADALTRQEVAGLIASSLRDSEVRQRAGVKSLVQQVALQAENRRVADFEQMAETFRYMQATQTNMWKEQLQSHQIVAVLAQKNGVSLSQ